MAKAIATVKDISWDSTVGFSGTVSYGLSGQGTFNSPSFTATIGVVTGISQPETATNAIQSAVVSDVLSRYSTTIINDDVIVI